MNFFRLRIINTLLLFLVGIVLGFILKEKFFPVAQAPAEASYPAPSAGRPGNLPAASADDEEPTDEPYTVQDPESGAAVIPPASNIPRRSSPARDEAEALVIEPAGAGGESRDARQPAVAGWEKDFFKSPAAYEGQELEMELQMITAKKAQRGWRINLVYTGPDREIDYLYVEDPEILGEKPDLRIGYAYKIRFLCGKGETASGNTLLKISATGEKAAWATGLSAVE